MLSTYAVYNTCVCVCLQGNTLPGWPVQMGEVQCQVLVADLNADGNMELFVGEWQHTEWQHTQWQYTQPLLTADVKWP